MSTVLGRAARSPRLTADARVSILSASLAGLAAVLLVTVVRTMDGVQAPVHLSWWVIALLSAISEVMVVHLEARREAHTVSFSDIPLTLGLILASPLGLVFGRLIGAGLTLILYRRQSARKVAFNLSLFALETIVALMVFHLVLGGAVPIDPGGWPAVFCAILAANLLGACSVTAVITLSSGTPPPHELVRRALLVSTLTGLVNAAIGIGIAAALWNTSPVALLFVPVAVGVYLINRTYVDLSERHRSLETLHTFSREVGGSLELDEVGRAVLRSACELMGCERADLVVVGADGASHRSSDREQLWSEELDHLDLAAGLDRYVPDGASAAIVDLAGPVPEWLAGTPYRDAVAAPLVGSNGPFGLLLVGDRMSDVRRFDDADLASFSTLVSHASKALENSGLFERIQRDAAERTHQALHDALTGLPNRHSLDEDLQAVLDTAADGEQVGLLLIDLECFKEVNDTLGHQAGDRLLCRVSQRFVDTAGPRESVYRFGGDEFVVVQRGLVDRDEALELAERLRASLDQPFEHDDLEHRGRRHDRRRRLPRPRQRPHRSDQAGGRRHVQRQGLPVRHRPVRPRERSVHAAPSRRRRAAAGGDPPARDHGPLPAQGRPPHQRDQRARGPRPLAPPALRSPRSRRVRACCGAQRCDPATDP